MSEVRDNAVVADSRRDDLPNNFVGDLVRTPQGRMVVPPTCCPEGRDYGGGGWSVRPAVRSVFLDG